MRDRPARRRILLGVSLLVSAPLMLIAGAPAVSASTPTTVSLTPGSDVNPVGTSHSVTATVQDAIGAPVAGVHVRFTVSGSTSATASCTTGSTGSCTFTYVGPTFPGADLILGCVDLTAVCDTATKAWILPFSTPGQATGGGQILSFGPISDEIVFGFTARSENSGPKGHCRVIDPNTDTQVKCLDVTILVQAGTQATFYGSAEINGTAASYQIAVNDGGESQQVIDTFSLVTSNGYAISGVVAKGNIQVHS
jgi:hypothetical protein